MLFIHKLLFYRRFLILFLIFCVISLRDIQKMLRLCYDNTMFVQNQTEGEPDHCETIVDALKASDEVCFAVAYVTKKGSNLILEHLKGKCARLLFDTDFRNTSGIENLLENNMDVRVHKVKGGILHSKVWLFNKGGNWTALIGSANLTGRGLNSNVEASILLNDKDITTSAVDFFKYLWDSDNTKKMTLNEMKSIRRWKGYKKLFKNKNIEDILQSDEELQHEIMLKLVKSWIDIAKWEEKGVSFLWRGWYISPDLGYVDDKLIKKLHYCVSSIGGKGINFEKGEFKMPFNEEGVLQAKNCLIEFGWAYHPLVKKTSGEIYMNKNVLYLSDMGMDVNACKSIAEIKEVYSEGFDEFNFMGFNLVKFTRNLLNKLDYLNLKEFNYFIVHAYSDDDLDIIINLILMYRRFSDKRAFDNEVKKYFGGAKDLTASNVYGNHTEKVKYTMSAIGWCSGFDFSADKFILKLYNDKN